MHRHSRSYNVTLHMGAKVDFQTKTGYFMSDIKFSTNASRHEINAIYSIAMQKYPKPILSSVKLSGMRVVLFSLRELRRNDIEMLRS